MRLLGGSRLVPALFVLNVALRLPAVFQDLPPFTFCDEDLYTYGSYEMHRFGTWRPTAFFAGGLNYYLPVLAAGVVAASGIDYTPTVHIVVARLLTAVALGALVPVLVWLIGRRFLDRRTALAAALVATISPMALGLSRIHYPDHYLAAFSAGLLYAAFSLVRAARPRGWYVASGVLVGCLVSIKYTGGVLAVLVVVAHALRARDQRSLRALLSRDAVLAAAAAIVTFVALNPFVLFEGREYLAALATHRTHYAAGHPGLETANGYRFHAEVLYLTSFGVLGGALALLGLVRSARSPERLGLLIVPTVVYVALLGSYPVGINRNLTGALPMVCLAMGLGLAYLLELTARPGWSPARTLALRVAVVALVSAEPAARTTWSLANDLQPDARRAAADWVAANVPGRSVIGVSRACWGVPLPTATVEMSAGGAPARLGHGLPATSADFTVKYLAMPARLGPGECLDYYVMDSWFYEHWGPGNSVFRLPVYSEHVFLNTGGVSYAEIRRAQDAFLAGFAVAKTFDRGYYGPAVTVYRSARPCARERTALIAATCPILRSNAPGGVT